MNACTACRDMNGSVLGAGVSQVRQSVRLQPDGAANTVAIQKVGTFATSIRINEGAFRIFCS